jgi:hypothetical protein
VLESDWDPGWGCVCHGRGSLGEVHFGLGWPSSEVSGSGAGTVGFRV